MNPPPGERLLRFVGDVLRFSVRSPGGKLPPGARALLRTNLGKAAATRREIISCYAGRRPLSISFWRDIPLQREADGGWSIELPLTEVGYFYAKAYVVDSQGRQHWPDGPDLGVSVHPNDYRTGNTIYCAFPRLFGATKAALTTRDERLEKEFRKLDERGYTVIPPSGKLRDVARELPHIVGTLGCHILHLLPVNPTPTTLARMGRFGSPYACQDLTAIDPALVEFDQRTTGVDQFRELTRATHARGARVFLDIVINHTGWGSTLFEQHPEWFLRHADGKFASPGAWGNIWADLVELDPQFTELWETLAHAFVTWCRRGVDGFRCDAGYKIPVPVWQYIVARVREEFPDTVFLLEGLGGSWEATENLLTHGGMQWAYSELFQNNSAHEVQWYLDYALRQSERVGLYVHYSETHDNNRLAAQGRAWSLFKNRLCALTSVSGAFGFTCGVEWLAAEKIEVHQSRGLSWGNPENIVEELAELNHLLDEHPCFFDGAKLTRLSPDDAPVYALRRDSPDGKDSLLILANTDLTMDQTFTVEAKIFQELGQPKTDLLSGPRVKIESTAGQVIVQVPAGTVHCLAQTGQPHSLNGTDYRRLRAQAGLAMFALQHVLPPEDIGACDWKQLAARVRSSPRQFLGAVAALHRPELGGQLLRALDLAAARYPQVVTWTAAESRRVTPVPPNHWLLICDRHPFRASLHFAASRRRQHVESVEVADGHAAFFWPPADPGQAVLFFEPLAEDNVPVSASIQFLAPEPSFPEAFQPPTHPLSTDLILLSNGLGGMARIRVDLGSIQSKYDCALGANLHPEFPVDRHVFAKRLRVWANADGFITPLNLLNLASVEPGPPARWEFNADAGDGRRVKIWLTADLLEGRNTTLFRFTREKKRRGDPARDLKLSLTVRVDIEDRNFHSETHRNSGAEHHFTSHCAPLSNKAGFAFTPGGSRELRVFSDTGFFHPEPEWSENIPHPIEQSRGQVGAGDAFSPGWFQLPIEPGQDVVLALCADVVDPASELIDGFEASREAENQIVVKRAKFPEHDSFGRQLALAARQFVVRRCAGKTVVAGYPWFLDWGRDSLICARGLLAAGLGSDVVDLLITFGRFVENGTMPNTIHGADAANRDTSDAPLWYGIVCEEAAASHQALYSIPVDASGRRITDVLTEIALGYMRGTPNGIKMDVVSGLIWSPKHFTWMDTNYPAGTPREGYPIEIQFLWIRLLRQLDRLKAPATETSWADLAARAEKSLHNYFWLEEGGYFADVLLAPVGGPARTAVPDTALRSNYLLGIALQLITGEKAQRGVEAAQRHLVIPGALRTLAPLPVAPPLPILGADGTLLNDPNFPYQGRYEGDEDTRRKPAYHNGTAWTWTFSVFCEALARAWDLSPGAVAAARAYLGSMEKLLQENCLGQIPEILDGDAPHPQRGCDAQAWGVTEALRVWKLLSR